MTRDEPIVLVICDDHRILTDALAILVDDDPDFALPAPPAQNPEAAIEQAREHHPDVVLMDVEFKGSAMSGIEATRAIVNDAPDTRVVIMTAHENDRLLVEAVEAGASGFIAKSEAATDVLAAVKAANEGEVLIDPDTLARLLQQVSREREAQRDAKARLDSLTEREREILALLAEAARNEDVATMLHIKPQTVQTHVRNILHKLGVHSKLEAVTYAVRNGAISV